MDVGRGGAPGADWAKGRTPGDLGMEGLGRFGGRFMDVLEPGPGRELPPVKMLPGRLPLRAAPRIARRAGREEEGMGPGGPGRTNREGERIKS